MSGLISGKGIWLSYYPIIYAVQLAREDYLVLRQEASELQEYSNAKLDRVTRYLGVLADKTRKLGKDFIVTLSMDIKEFQKGVFNLNFLVIFFLACINMLEGKHF